jgi:DNA-binding NarL/FixJ family response regulator
MSATPTLRILLVSKPGDAKEISDALVGAGFSAPAIAAGGDDTLTLYEELAPAVVVLCASLEHGDARSLAAAMRTSSRPLGIVLVGDAEGPIRNALDAADLEVDRFVGRPLSAKALVFAVRSCASEVGEAERARARSNGEPANGQRDAGRSWPTPRPLPPPPATPERPPIVRAGTTPGTGPPMPPGPISPSLERAMNEAIARFVTDAMNALESGWALDADRDDDAVTDDGPGQEPDAAEPPPEDARHGDGKVKEPAVDPSAVTQAADLAHPGSADARWSEPPAAPAWREPTLILPDGGRTPVRETPGQRAPAGPVDRVDVDITARQSSSPWDDDFEPDAVSGAAPVAPLSASGSMAQTNRASVPSSPPPSMDLEEAPAAITRPIGGDSQARADLDASGDSQAEPKSPLARELRRKMSMMADRLFPGRGGDRSRLDVGLAHDAHTDIDLTAIGLETVEGAGSSAPYEGIGSVDTFADTNPLSRLEPTPEPMSADDGEDTNRRRSITGEPPPRGDLADIDVASLLGRLLQSRFTGRVQFRRGPAEKMVHFEDGRPIFAISNLPHDRMGDLLYREGKITREQQQRARDLVVESGRRMGEILVEIGFLKPRELLPAVRHHIEDIVYSLFAWDSGEFVISAGDPTSERIRLTRHPAALVLEGVRRKYGGELIEARLRSQSAVVAVRSQRRLGSISAVADLSPSERAVIQKLDGERTIQQAAEAAQVDPLIAFQLAWALIALGVAEVVDHGPLASEPTPVRPRSLVGETDIAIDRQRVLAKYALVQEADYFTLLGVRRDATAFEIRRAYEAARRDYSALGFPPEVQRELAGELGEINRLIDEAYLVLREERVRRSYQANLLD